MERRWQPGDIYNPADPTHATPTKNIRLKLLNSGLWSKKLVDRITKGRRQK